MSSKKASGKTKKTEEPVPTDAKKEAEPVKASDEDEEDYDSEEGSDSEGSDSEEGASDSSSKGRRRGGRKKSRKTGERALVNTKLQGYAKDYGLRAARTGVFIEQWIQSNLRYFETEEGTCFDGKTRDRDLETSPHGIQINYTFVNMKCGDVPVETRKLIHRRLSAVVQDGVATSCQLCLNTGRKTLSHKILKPALDMALHHMLEEPVQPPIEPIVVVKRKKRSAQEMTNHKKAAAEPKKVSTASKKKGPATKKQKVAVVAESVAL